MFMRVTKTIVIQIKWKVTEAKSSQRDLSFRTVSPTPLPSLHTVGVGRLRHSCIDFSHLYRFLLSSSEATF